MRDIVEKCIEAIDFEDDEVCDEASPGSSNCLDCFQKMFYGGNEISYDCDEKIDIYIARYFPVHVKENLDAICLFESEERGRLSEIDRINVLSIGGGPGTDIYAIKKYFLNLESSGLFESSKKIYFLRLDREECWNDIAKSINSSILDTEKLIFEHRRFNCDITEEKWLRLLSKKLDFQIFSISYFINECSEESLNALIKWINMLSSTSFSAVLINDYDSQNVHESVHRLFEKLQCNEDIERSNTDRSWCGFMYKDEVRDILKPKLKKSSIRYLKVLYK